MKLVIAGSSGFLGTALRDRLARDGHEVTRLVRGEARTASESAWDPYSSHVDRAVIESADVVVNLAGRPLAGNPHSAAYRKSMRESRVRTTATLAEAIAASDRKPTFLAQNGTSYYGDRGDEVLTEESGTGEGSLLTPITRVWQEAAEIAADGGARTCILRTGPVLHRSGGALPPILRAFKTGLGGRLGSGAQYFPIMSLRDWVEATLHLATHEESSGPYNMVGPAPCTNAEFTEALGTRLHRPTKIPVPSFVLKRAAGQISPELLGSFRIVPAKLLAEGFTFRDPDVGAILDSALER